MLAYIETLMAEYQMDLPTVMLRLRLAAGFALLEGRAARLAPEHTIGYIDRAVMQARAAVREWYAERFEVVPTPPR